MSFTGRAVAWLAPRSSPATVAAVYVDGRFVKNVYLSSSGYEPRRIVFSMSWKDRGTHTVRIVKKYPSYALPVDALLVLT